jgi:aconitate decarboxylase
LSSTGIFTSDVARSGVGPVRPYTKILAEFVSALEFSAIPAEVRDRVPYIMLDGLGCGLYGSALPWSRLLTESIMSLGSAGPASLWGYGRTVSADHAALLNGSYVQAYELDDYSRDGALHACALVLPAVFGASSLRSGVTGADVIAAMVAGFEVGNRVGRFLGPTRLTRQGWHTGPVIGPIAAAAAAGRVLELDGAAIEHAFGIAATQAGGLMAAGFGSMVKRMHHGRAAQSGLYGAVLASRGYLGIDSVFERPYGGYGSTFTGHVDRDELEILVDGLGSRWLTLETCFKPYACSAKIHPALDALRAIRAQRAFALEELVQLRVGCTDSTKTKVGWRYTGSGSATEAQMNLGYSLAVFLLEGDAFVSQYRPELLTSPRVLALLDRIAIEHDPAFDDLEEGRRHHVRVEVELIDRTVLTKSLDFAFGSPSRPLSNDAVVDKFDKLVIGRRRAAADVKQLVLDLATVRDINVLQDALAAA